MGARDRCRLQGRDLLRLRA
uniref:Uncharacterized protein n=1 Tax=Arundo donax TaxID=35708 RepID=A0A0A9H8P2_ARUDO